MKKKRYLKTILIIITILIMIPVTLATLIWLMVSLGSDSLLIKLIFLPIKLALILPIIKWGIFIVFIIWTLYGIINAYNKKQEGSEIEKI